MFQPVIFLSDKLLLGRQSGLCEIAGVIYEGLQVLVRHKRHRLGAPLMMTPHVIELIKSGLLLTSLYVIDVMRVLLGGELVAAVVVVHGLLLLYLLLPEFDWVGLLVGPRPRRHSHVVVPRDSRWHVAGLLVPR